MFVEPLNYAKLKSLEFQLKCSLEKILQKSRCIQGRVGIDYHDWQNIDTNDIPVLPEVWYIRMRRAESCNIFNNSIILITTFCQINVVLTPSILIS